MEEMIRQWNRAGTRIKKKEVYCKRLHTESGSYDRRYEMSINQTRDRYESLKKRDFKSALINLLENDYKS